MLKQINIKTKILLYSLLSMIIITNSLIYLSHKLSERTMENVVDDHLSEESFIHAQILSNWIIEKAAEISSYSHNSIFKTMEWNKIEPFLTMDNLMKSKTFSFFYIEDKYGNYKSTMQNKNEIFNENIVETINLESSVIESIKIQTNLLVFKDKNYFAITSPIVNEKGEIIGKIGGIILFKTLINVNKRVMEYDDEDTFTFILNKNSILSDEQNNNLDRNLSKEIYFKIQNKILKNEEIVKEIFKINKKNYYAYPSDITKIGQWKLIIIAPEKRVLDPFIKIHIKVVLISIFGFILHFIVSNYLSKIVSKPIVELNNIVIKASKGELTTKAKIDSNDEIGQLSKSFNHFMDTIDSLTYYDSHTKLPNKKVFNEQLKATISRTKDKSLKLAVVSIGLDKFKYVNDAYGNSIGDEVLLEIANRMKENLKEQDIFCKITGDEFGLIFSELENEKDIIRYIEKILSDIKEPMNIEGNKINITASAGIAFYPKDGHAKDILIKNSNISLHRAKNNSTGSYNIFSLDMKKELLDQIQIEKLLSEAIEKDEFILQYQSIVDSNTSEIVGVESLIRWKNYLLGMVPPDKFITVAEETGLINEIGEWVLKTACIQNKRWQNQGHEKIYISVNISLIQFQDKNFVQTVKNILNETGLEPKYLCLEITESIAMKNEVYAINILQELRDIGIIIAMDDFGTGYSSLGYLHKLPFDILKVDKSFISDISEIGNDSIITSAIISLGHSLNLKIVAEGVETVEQLTYLKSKGCNFIQGYLFSKPVSDFELEKLLEKSIIQLS